MVQRKIPRQQTLPPPNVTYTFHIHCTWPNKHDHVNAPQSHTHTHTHTCAHTSRNVSLLHLALGKQVFGALSSPSETKGGNCWGNTTADSNKTEGILCIHLWSSLFLSSKFTFFRSLCGPFLAGLAHLEILYSAGLLGTLMWIANWRWELANRQFQFKSPHVN